MTGTLIYRIVMSALRRTRAHVLLAAWMLLSGVLLSSCGRSQETLVLVTVAGLSDEIHGLRITEGLNGQEGSIQEIFADLAKFALRLPIGTHGKYGVQVEGLNSADCVAAQGYAETNVDGEPRYTLSVTLTPQDLAPGCEPVPESMPEPMCPPDGIKNGTETDIDCGGGICQPCVNTKSCIQSSDCLSNSCQSGKCATPLPMCKDGIKDGGESDVDCGGACPSCAIGKFCAQNSECSSGRCQGGVCACPVGQAFCGGTCRDVTSDNYNCGACGSVCNGRCINSACVTACSNGSRTNCNVPGTTLGGSEFYDSKPPPGWVQCAGFINTASDDVTSGFIDNCLNSTNLRVRVFDSSGVNVVEDVVASNTPLLTSWPTRSYVGGTMSFFTRTWWGTTQFFVTRDGMDSCGRSVGPSNMTAFGSGLINTAIIAPGNTGYDEYRISCNGGPLPNFRIALYKQ